MNKILIALLVLLSVLCRVSKKNSLAKPVNTDSPQAVIIEPRQFIKFLPNKLNENSGIIFYNNMFTTINDRGGKIKYSSLKIKLKKIEFHFEIDSIFNA
jgi:hypothetical protein